MKSDVMSLIHEMKPSIKKSLPKEVHGVTLDDGTIIINNKLSPVQQKIAESHERVHREQILRKDLSYDEDYVYWKNKDFEKVNIELLLAQAALESGWGDSRFAKVGKNLFGIRTYDLQEPHMLPSNKPKKWGVKVYEHECYSVEHYIKILNNGTSFGDYRKLREDGIDDPMILVETLGAYASDKNYFPKIKSIIKKIRKEYNIK